MDKDVFSNRNRVAGFMGETTIWIHSIFSIASLVKAFEFLFVT